LRGSLPKHDVFGDGERGHQHEVLVHHADAQIDGPLRVLNLDCATVQQNLAVGRLLQAVEDLHEGALPRAVFTHQRVDFPLFHGKIHPFVGDHAVGVDFGDLLHFDERRHGCGSCWRQLEIGEWRLGD
jgi:hypothetical protein